jgi:hypothetical protein
VRKFDRLHPNREFAGRTDLTRPTGSAWHLVEFAIAVGAGIAAGSIALIGFGADSLIEASWIHSRRDRVDEDELHDVAINPSH